MMKKIFIIVVTLLLTGCSVTYNLEITEDGIKESINGTINSEEFDNPNDKNPDLYIYSLIYEDQSPFNDGKDRYLKEVKENGNNIEFSSNYIYKENYKNSRVLDECYQNAIFEESDDYYIIKLNGDFYCLLSDKINVNITTDYSVLNSNANRIKDNTYSWIITSKNSDIEMQISKTKKPEYEEKSVNYFRMIGLIIFVVLCTVSFFTYKFHQKKK